MDNKIYSSKEGRVLPIVSQKEAIKRANRKIYHAMVTRKPGLITRWHKVNEAMGGFFRFAEITYLAGPSGGGKSFILNMIREDFAGTLNVDYPEKFKILAFTFEMGADDEVIRTYSSRLKTSYSKLLSSYNKITHEYYKMIERTSLTIDSDLIFYVEIPGDREQIMNTVEHFQNKFPDHKLVITIDHTLLMSHLDEKGEIELVTNMSRLAMLIKKRFGAMVILLGQLNDKIEQSDRIRNPILHYPKKTDIHGSKSVYMAADTISIIHRPELLQIKRYGPKEYDTDGLVVWHFLKSRLHGKEGVIRMRSDFEHGNLVYPYA